MPSPLAPKSRTFSLILGFGQGGSPGECRPPQEERRSTAAVLKIARRLVRFLVSSHWRFSHTARPRRDVYLPPRGRILHARARPRFGLYSCRSLGCGDCGFGRDERPSPPGPQYLGGADSTQYSSLKQINKSNVKQLESPGVIRPGARQLIFNPIVVDGVMYVLRRHGPRLPGSTRRNPAAAARGPKPVPPSPRWTRPPARSCGLIPTRARWARAASIIGRARTAPTGACSTSTPDS